MRWEYMVIMLAGNQPLRKSEMLSTLGREGWRLFQIDQGQAYLERQTD